MAALDFNPLDFFIEEIKSDEAEIRIASVNRLNLIASALGPQKTVSELIPVLIRAVEEQPLSFDEEFLYCVAKQYAVLADYISGQDEVLIPPLENLAAQEETAIRDQAIQSLCQIVERKPALVQQYLVPTLHRLSVRNDFFTARVSACALFPTAYKYSEDSAEKDKLRKAYVNICQDDTPMVRRAAANKMRDLVQVCDKQDFLDDMITIYKKLSQDDTQDTIRVAVVQATLVVAEMFNAEENRQHTIKVIEDAVGDRSWRVRLTVAKNFSTLCKNFGPEIMVSHLLPCICTLMKDHELDVRREAVQAIAPCLDLPSPITAEHLQTFILPMFQQLALDPAQQVRAALAKALGPMAKTLGADVTQRQLLPLISDLMKDEFHDVRLNIVSHAGLVCEVLGVDGLVHSLLHTIQSLIMDNHWRIRQSVVEQVPKLAKLFGVEMFQSKLEALFLSSLRDSVHSVRHAAILHLKDIVATFGPAWTVDHLMPKILEQYSQSVGYANRVTTLMALVPVSHVMKAAEIDQYVSDLLIKGMKDSVPNVRFCACKTVVEIIEGASDTATLKTKLKPTLSELEHDSDTDVVYYAQCALKLM